MSGRLLNLISSYRSIDAIVLDTIKPWVDIGDIAVQQLHLDKQNNHSNQCLYNNKNN
jgi:hypothetical protein